MKLKHTKLALAAALALTFSATSQAVIQVNDWMLDASAAGQGLTGDTFGGAEQHRVSPINQITFLDVFHSVTADANSNGVPDVGETFNVTAGGLATDFLNSSNSSIRPLAYGYNGSLVGDGSGLVDVDGWEFTFTFSVDGKFTDIDANDANFVHTAGTLELYIDNLTDGAGSAANLNAQTGISDGALVASFELVPGDGGVFDFVTGDGSDDATFRLVSALPGVLLASDGTDLSTLLGPGGDPLLLAFTDSNFDSNPNNVGPFSFIPAGFNCGSLATDFCGEEDGSLRFAIPEPATLALLGVGLLGFGVTGFVRRRKIISH